MAQVNHNAAYITVVDGLTVWERLRNIRSFINDRLSAFYGNDLHKQENVDALSKYAEETDEAKRFFMQHSYELYLDLKSEIDFLRELESKLAAEAEKTRINGMSDREMYEINYYEELVQMQLLQAQSEMMSGGILSPETMKTILRNPQTLSRAVEVGLLSSDIRKITNMVQSPAAILLGAYNE